jgi:hypothetical protein
MTRTPLESTLSISSLSSTNAASLTTISPIAQVLQPNPNCYSYSFIHSTRPLFALTPFLSCPIPTHSPSPTLSHSNHPHQSRILSHSSPPRTTCCFSCSLLSESFSTLSHSFPSYSNQKTSHSHYPHFFLPNLNSPSLLLSTNCPTHSIPSSPPRTCNS